MGPWNRRSTKGLVASCHDCSDGGLGVALAETAFAGDLGMEVDLRKAPSSGIERDDFLLFSESASRFVVTIHPEDKRAFEACLQGNVFSEVGKITPEKTIQGSWLKGKRRRSG